MYKKVLGGAAGLTGTSYIIYKLFFSWLGKDLQDMVLFNKLRKKFMRSMEEGSLIADYLEKIAQETPDKYFVISNDRIYTYGNMLQSIYCVAQVVRTWNLQKGDVVAVFMEGEPNFLQVFFGLQMLGIPVALLNHNLRGASLEHSLRCVDAKVVIGGADNDLVSAMSDLKQRLPQMKMYVHGCPYADLPENLISLSDMTKDTPPTPIPKETRADIGLNDICVFIYTSGTTGLPKAVPLSHLRIFSGLCLLPIIGSMTSDDRLYVTVPLYHSSGLIIGLMGALGAGCTMVLRKKFSASHFWEDCCKHRVTVIQYIGELCRYLLSQPESWRDKSHNVRIAIGNGLRQDIWLDFKNRFQIPHIVEFFAATEGPALLLNLHDEPGACGRYSPLMKFLDPFPKYLLEYELGTDQPKRAKNGLCVEVTKGSPGLLVTAFPPHVSPETIYKADKATVEKKIVRDVFKKGDLFFNYGDLLSLDSNYFFRFADRVGDTFRWKGENVSTQEVANVLTKLDFIMDANVYGVSIPGRDGKAGMASLILNTGNQDLTESMCGRLYKAVRRALPSYARPLFLRILGEMELTGTYKQRKVNLVKEGFNPNTIQDPLFYLENSSKSYVPFTEKLHTKIFTGDAKL